MSDDTQIQVVGFEETLKKIDFLDSFKINDRYLVPAFRKIGGAVRKEEKSRIPAFTGSTQKSISNSVTTNGIGSVTAKIGSKKRYYILRFIDSGAAWHGRSDAITTWRGREQHRNLRVGGKNNENWYTKNSKPNPAFIPPSRLVEWVKKKLSANEGNALSVAFAVAKSIGRKGLKARPVIAPTLAAVRNMVVTETKKAIDKMLQELGKYG